MAVSVWLGRSGHDCDGPHWIRSWERAHCWFDLREIQKGGETMQTYERPALTALGSFTKLTGLGDHGHGETLLPFKRKF